MKKGRIFFGSLMALLLLAVLCISLPTKAQAATYGSLTYEVENGEVTITDCDENASGELIIPDTIDGYPVTGIGAWAFEYCYDLTSVTIPNSVTSIGEWAFVYCDNLISVTIPESMISIGEYAFYSGDSLNNVYITDIVAWCNISFSGTASNPMYYAENIYLNGYLLTELLIPDSVNSIGAYAFSAFNNLTSVTIPDSVISIGKDAFSHCYSLTSVKIPDSVTHVGEYAFYDCYNLASVTIGDGVTSIGEHAFSNCDSLTEVTIPKNVTSIGEYAFYDCYNLASVTIGDGVTRIGGHVFSDCDSLTKVTISNGVTSIGDYAFSSCYRLTSVTIPDSVTSIGECAFYGCVSIISVTIPDSVTSIAEGVFCECYSLNHIYFTGTQMQWENISIGEDNWDLENATIHCNHVHDYSLFDPVVVAATCTEAGYTDYTCVYGEIHREVIQAHGHTKGDNATTFVPTCMQGGYTQSNCAHCGLLLTTDVVPALGHDFSSSIETVQPTCEEEGWTGPGCSRCDAVRSDTVIDALGHSVVAVSAVEPTCTKAGHGVGTQCQRCKKYMMVPEVKPALGHSFGKWNVIKEPTVTAQGSKCRECTRCGASETAAIPKLPKINTQPVNQYLSSGKTAKFTVKVTGTGLKYQWQYRTSATGKWIVASATGSKTASMSVSVTAAQNGYQYRCKITDQYGNAVYSNAATLTCVTLKFTSHPVNQNLMTGKTAKFTVKATGTELKYQWQYRTSSTGAWKNASGTGNKTATLRVAATAARNGYQYRCQITDKYGNTAYSKVATLKIVVFKVTAQPANKYLPAGKTAKFTVKASGTGLKYQWQYRTSSKGSWKAASATGSKTATLSVAATAARNGWQYRCKITDKYGNVLYSNAAALKIVTLKITTQPASVKLASGKTATFKIAAKGTELKYQWQYRTASSGAWKKASATGNKTATVKVPVTAAKNGYQYRCKITDKYGNVLYSKAATLTVTGGSSYPKASVTDAYLRLVGNCCYHIPKINLPGNAAAEVNKKIYDDAMDLINRNSEGLGDYFGGLYYTWYQYKDIISVVMVEYWTGSEQAYAYTVSATTGKELTNAQVAQKAGYTETKCQSLARSAAEKYYQVYSDNYTYFPSQEFSGLVASSKTASASWQYIVDNKGNLCFVGLIWTGFGKGASDYIIYQNGSTYLPYCQKH